MSTSVSLQGRELIAAWSMNDRGLGRFVLQLADFDTAGEWREDGHATCAAWLTDKCQMSRSDAFGKLKMSHELRRRHVVRAALVGGLPYTKVLWLLQLEGVDHDRDEEYVAYARTDTVKVLEQRVRNWNYFNTQDKKPSNLDDHYGIVVAHGFAGGLGKATIEAPNDMLDAFMALVDAYGETLRRAAKPEQLELEPVDKSNNWTPQPRRLAAQRLDWLFDLVQEARLADPSKFDAQTATIGVTIQYEDLINKTGCGLSSQGSTLTPEAIERLMCDAGILRIVVKGQSEILDFGREERLFPRAVRRAIRFRHAHVCAVRGCGRRHTQIHHLTWWEDGGETTIDNGIPLCPFHHHLVHEGGWAVAWNPTTGVVTLKGPRGQILETTASFLRAA
jgi:hypothetical protein